MTEKRVKRLRVVDDDGTLVERRSDAELVPRFVARVPGVVAVDSTLRWAWDDVKAAKDGGTRADVRRW